MRIGINLDNTICRTDEEILKYEKPYLRKRRILHEDLWNDSLYRIRFLEKNLKDIYRTATIKLGIKSAIKYLRQNHEVFIITSRDDSIVEEIQNDTIKYLIRENIVVDGIFFNIKDKLKLCKEEKIDVLIDDDKSIFKKIRTKKIKCILYDDKEQAKEVENRLTRWSEINKLI